MDTLDYLCIGKIPCQAIIFDFQATSGNVIHFRTSHKLVFHLSTLTIHHSILALGLKNLSLDHPLDPKGSFDRAHWHLD